MEQMLQQILTKIDSIESTMLIKFDEIDKRFIAIDKRFDEIDKKFIAIDKRFDEVDKKFIAIDKRFDEVDKKFIAIDKALEKRFSTIDKKLHSISEQVAFNTEQESRIFILETEVRIIKKAIANM